MGLFDQKPEQLLLPYLEEGKKHHPLEGVHTHGWMEHQIPLDTHSLGAGSLLEVSVRALDVALVIGALEINGQSLLKL